MADETAVQNAADVRQVRDGRKRERRRVLDEAADLKSVLSTPAGRRFYWLLLDRCGIFLSGAVADPLRLAILAGGREVGLRLLRDAQENALEEFLTMQREALERGV